MDKIEDRVLGESDVRKILDAFETRIGDTIDEKLKKKDNNDGTTPHNKDSEEKEEEYLDLDLDDNDGFKLDIDIDIDIDIDDESEPPKELKKKRKSQRKNS